MKLLFPHSAKLSPFPDISKLWTNKDCGILLHLPHIAELCGEKLSEDWDDILDVYESYVDNYISYLKKATNGDIEAMEEVEEMLEDAQELSEKLDNAEDDLSSSQMSRYIKITSKLASAAADMSY